MPFRQAAIFPHFSREWTILLPSAHVYISPPARTTSFSSTHFRTRTIVPLRPKPRPRPPLTGRRGLPLLAGAYRGSQTDPPPGIAPLAGAHAMPDVGGGVLFLTRGGTAFFLVCVRLMFVVPCGDLFLSLCSMSTCCCQSMWWCARPTCPRPAL